MTVRELIMELLRCDDLDEEVIIDFEVDGIPFESKIFDVRHYLKPSEVRIFGVDHKEV